MASSATQYTIPTPKGQCRQRYRAVWEQDPRFEGWLAPELGSINLARCRVCSMALLAHIKSLVSHGNSKKHKKQMITNSGALFNNDDSDETICNAINDNSMKSNASGGSSNSCIAANGNKNENSLIDSVFFVVLDPTKVAELKIALFISEHSSTPAVDHLGGLLPQLDLNSGVLQIFKMNRIKCAQLQRDVIAPCFAKTLITDIGNQHFSFIVDEITSEANLSCLAITVRYYSTIKKVMVDTFYRLVPVQDCRANTLYAVVKKCLDEDKLNIDNLIGIGSDGGNSILSQNNSLVTFLKNDNPDITIFRCVCHSLHLAASNASYVLPSVLTFIIRETYAWFSNCPKRPNAYREIYNILVSSKPEKEPGMAATQWLADLEIMNVFIDHWDKLGLHFETAASKDRCHIAKLLCDAYKDPKNGLFMLYARKVLKEVIKVNKLFQAENPDVTKLTHDLFNMYRSLLRMVVHPNYLSRYSNEDLPRLNFIDHVMPISALNFGYEFNNTLLKCSLNEAQVNNIKNQCGNFVIALINEVKLRLPDSIDTLLMLKQLQSENAMSQCKESIVSIADKYQYIFDDMDELENEWSNLSSEKWSQSGLENPVKFWGDVRLKKNSEGEELFPNISSFALALLSLPFSNAYVKRIFSQIKQVQSKLKNPIIVRSVEAVLQIQCGLKRENETCASFIPTAEMMDLYDAQNLSTNIENWEDDCMAIDFVV